MKSIHLKKNIFQFISSLFILAVLSSCSVKKSSFKIVKHIKQDTTAQAPTFGAIKGIGIDDNMDKGAILFDQFIANDFQLSKKKRDSAAVVNYFKKTAFEKLGRKEFQQWDLVEVRGVLFQVNVEERTFDRRPLFSYQSIAEIIGMVLMFLVYYF